MYFRAIQGHSGGNFVSLSLQGNVLLPDHFAENIYHIGNAFEMHSIIKSGLIPGGKSLRRDRQSVFFRSSEPDGRKSRSGRKVQYNLDSSLLESSLVEKKGITSAVLASHQVVVLCGTETNRHCGKYLIAFLLHMSLHMTNAVDGSTSQYFALTSDHMRFDP